MKQRTKEIIEELDRIEDIRVRSKFEFDKLSPEEQREELALDYLASILVEAYLDSKERQK